MNEKEINITIPEGYEIDKEKSSFEKIVFKKIKKRWRDDENQSLQGCYIDNDCTIKTANTYNISPNYNVFATEKHAKRAIAEARISQIMENDERFGGVVSYAEWADVKTTKFIIKRMKNQIIKDETFSIYNFLAFHTKEQRDLFLEENKDLVKDYLMID